MGNIDENIDRPTFGQGVVSGKYRHGVLIEAMGTDFVGTVIANGGMTQGTFTVPFKP